MDETEAARDEQGRVREGPAHQANQNNNNNSSSSSYYSWVKIFQKNKRWLVLFGLCFCLIIVIWSTFGYFVLLRQEEETNGPNDVIRTKAPRDDGAELEAVISFDPPSAEDCVSIANGTDVAGQEAMFTEFVDMHVQITTESEEEKAFFITLLKQQIQENLIPRLVGCGDLEGNVIGNGVVQSVNNETSTCLSQNNPLCLEVVLTVKIYLRHQEDGGTTAVEIMSELLLDEDLNESLDLPPTVSVGIPVIVPSNFSTSVPTETPSWSPSSVSSNTGSEVGSSPYSARPI